MRRTSLPVGGPQRRLSALALLMLLATVFTAVVAVTAGYRSWQNALLREEKLLRGTTGSLIATIDRRLEVVEAALAGSLSHEEPGHVSRLGAHPIFNATHEYLRALSLPVDSIGIADLTGRVVAASPETFDPVDATAMAAQALAHHSREGADATLIVPGIQRGRDQRIVFVVSRALRDNDAKLRGVAFAALPIEDLVATVAETIKRDGGRVTIVNGAYHVIARLPRASLGADLSQSPISRAIQAGNRAGIIRVRSTIDGIEILTSYASSPRFPLHVVMSKDIPTIRAIWYGEQRLEFLLLALLFLGTLLSNVALHRAMRRQLAAESALRSSDQLRYQQGLEGAQRRIVASEEKFRDGIESMNEGFVLWDEDDRLVAWNERALQLLPHQAPLMQVGARFADILAHLDQLSVSQASLSSWRLHLDERRRRRERIGTTRVFRSGGGRIIEAVDRGASDGRIVSIYRDITEQRNLLDQLRASEAELRRALAAERDMNEQQRRFVAMASHEFRTPLAIIDSAAQRLISVHAAPTDAMGHKRLQRIRMSVSRMTEIIDRTLVTARLDAGTIELVAAPFDLNELAHEVAQRQLTITPDHEIGLALPPGALTIDADRRLIDQVLTNLLSNAVKYGGALRRAELRIALESEEVVIAVSDQGLGIPADELDRVFTRFFRASTSAGIAGTGVGLHLVREFVTMHGGQIELRSEIARGSTFTVRIPRKRPIEATQQRA